ncbi:MAG: SgcJ/EcaC family oxidoreductase, partial [Erythrobacter sp.]
MIGKFLQLAAATFFLCQSHAILAQERWAVPEYRVFGEPSSEADPQAVERLLQSYRLAWSAQDAKALADLHTPDTEWTNAFARIIQGRDQLEAFLGERMFPGFPKAISEAEARSLTPVSLRFLGDDAAIWHIFA